MRLNPPLRIALVYAIAGVTWIVVGDWLLLQLAPDTTLVGQLVKRLLFVLLSAALIFVLVRGELRKREQLDLERETLNQRLAGGERLEAIGRLTAGIAHDFNNLLTAISGNLESYLKTSVPEDQAPLELTEAASAARRAEQLTGQLLAFGRRQDIRARPLDLNAEIREISQLLHRLIGDRIEIETSLADDLWVINMDRGPLQQVVMNLSLNARDAMPGGGKLTIATSNRAIDANAARREFEFPVVPGEYVRLVVEDTGVGMDAETQERIYEPFFTTKEKHSGTGLGLSTVFGIVKQAGGYIDVKSHPGEGTRFSLYFPHGEGQPVADAADVESAPADGTGSVLVVEDEPAVRSLVVRTLRRHGFTTFECASGPEALTLLNASASPPLDLLLTDAIMPGMTGIELIEEVRGTHPDLPILLMSGYADGELDSDSPYLPKPFTTDQLLTSVRRLLV